MKAAGKANKAKVAILLMKFGKSAWIIDFTMRPFWKLILIERIVRAKRDMLSIMKSKMRGSLKLGIVILSNFNKF